MGEADDSMGDFAATWAQFCESERHFELPGGQLAVSQDWSVGHGGTVYDAALTAVRHCVGKGEPFWRAKRVLELGSGTGAVGLAAAKLGARPVCLTDVPGHMALLEANGSGLDGVDWQPLVWGEPVPPGLIGPDVLIGCDLIYATGRGGESHSQSMQQAEQVHAALARTIDQAALEGTLVLLVGEGAPWVGPADQGQ